MKPINESVLHVLEEMGVDRVALVDEENQFYHGFCLMFAAALHDLVQWKIMAEHDPDGELIHAWTVSDDGKAVDVFGVHDSEYAQRPDWIEVPYLENTIAPWSGPVQPSNDEEEKAYKTAVKLINKNPQKYGIDQ